MGLPVSLTGQFSLQGKQTLAGIRAWANDVNRSGGLRAGGESLPVEVIWYDDASSRAQTREITNRLISDDRVDLLVGPYSAVLTNTAAEVAQAHCKLLWNQGGASPLVYRRGNPWVVGILTPADEYFSGLLSAVREVHPEAGTVAIVRAATGAFPRDVAEGVERAADSLSFRIVLSSQFDANMEDLSETAEAARLAAPDVLVAVGRFQNDLTLAEALVSAFAGMKGVTGTERMKEGKSVGAAAVVAAGVDAFRERLGDAAEGFIGPSQWEPDVGYAPDIGYAVEYGPSVPEVQDSLRRAGHPVVDYPMAQAYAVGVVIQRCVEECGSLDGRELRQAAAALDFTTFYGRFRIDADTGRPTGKPALLVQWKEGRKVIVWPPERRSERLAYTWRQQVADFNCSNEVTL